VRAGGRRGAAPSNNEMQQTGGEGCAPAGLVSGAHRQVAPPAADLGVVLTLAKHENEKDVGTAVGSRSGARESKCVGQGPCRAGRIEAASRESFLDSSSGC
jgi:hypothetical protein